MKNYVCAFVLHKKSKGDDTAHLVCRVKWAASRRIVSLNVGFVVDPEKWEAKTQQCLPRSVHGPMRIAAQTINAEILRYREVVAAQMARADEDASVEQMRGQLKAALGIGPSTAEPTLSVWADFVKAGRQDRIWSEGTGRTLGSFRQHLAAYVPFRTMDGFTEENLNGFVQFLRNERRLRDTTNEKQLGFLHWFLAWSDEHGRLECKDYTRFHPKFKKPGKPVVFLSWDELMTVWDYEPESRYHRNVLDVFLFCCFTSLRFSDAQNLRWADVKGDTIHIPSTIKTAEALIIELNEWSQEILSRHVDEDNGDDYVFPRISNPVMNRYLKRIMEDCGLKAPVHVTEFRGSERIETTQPKYELIGTHTGRRTFICNALMMGISPTTVMQWTGHSDYKAMKPYIAVADEARKEAMKVFNLRR